MSYEISEEKFVHRVDKDILRGDNVDEAPLVLGFGVFYGDGSSFFGQTVEDWKNAPKEDVQTILLYYDKMAAPGVHFRYAINGWDYYSFDGECYMASNDTRNLSSKHLLYGRWMETEAWKNIATKAMRTRHTFSRV